MFLFIEFIISFDSVRNAAWLRESVFFLLGIFFCIFLCFSGSILCGRHFW